MAHWWSTDDITVDWLAQVVGVVDGFSVEPFVVSTTSVTVRVHLSSRDPSCPATVIVKSARPDHTGSDEPFRRDHLFYSRPPALALRTVAPCLHAHFDPARREFWLVLVDAGPVRHGNELVGLTRGKAHLTVAALADVHATFGRRAADVEWIPATEPIDHRRLGELYVRFVENFGERIDLRDLTVANRIVASIDAIVAHREQTSAPRGVVHGDFRLGNILLGRSGSDRPITITGWQGISWGLAATDLAYFLGTMDRSMRLDYGDTLITVYQESLGDAASGSLESLRRDVRDNAFICLLNVLVSWSATDPAPGSDELWLTLFGRACAFLTDLDGSRPVGAARSVMTYVDPTDESAHPPKPGGEWNETWYLDVADPAAGIGAFLRFGVGPENPDGWFALAVSGPHIPTVTVTESGFDLGRMQSVRTQTMSATHVPVIPLAHVHVTVDAVGAAYDDPAGVGRGVGGRPVGVRLDLHWYTSGDPYQYDLTRVYEIPCMVTGSITLAGDGLPTEPIPIDAPGQRDHAWDGQNWWHIQWFWLSAHFEDGTRVHGVDIRLPSLPSISMGYAQQPAAPLLALDKCRLVDADTDPDQVRAMTFALEPGSMTMTFRAVAQAPQRTQSVRGSVSVMPRAWGEFTRSDGRRGVGWVEWNTGSPNL